MCKRTNIERDDDATSKRRLIQEALATFVAVKAQERRRATYRDRLEHLRARVGSARLGVDTRDLLRSDREAR